MGLVPATARVGDIVCVFLGCLTPMLVRPINEKESHYLLAGSCYIHGLMDSETLLGPLPEGWRANYSKLDNYLYVSPDGVVTNQDPRLEPLSSDWEIYYEGGPKDGQGQDRKPLYRHKVQHQGARTDPRLSAGYLKAKGVKIETLTLV